MQGVEQLKTCPWMLEARRLIGTREIAGPQHSSAVVRMWESIKAPFRDDETPWCAAYVGHCLEAAGVNSTKSAAARSYLNWGQDYEGPYQYAYGAVVILNRPGSAWSGHVGFLTGYDGDAEVFQLLSGNCNNQVQFAEYPYSRVLGVRVPGYPSFGTSRCPPFYAKGTTSRSDA